VEIESIHWCAVATMLSMPPNVEAVGAVGTGLHQRSFDYDEPPEHHACPEFP
jgi:hypothetical protein